MIMYDECVDTAYVRSIFAWQCTEPFNSRRNEAIENCIQ